MLKKHLTVALALSIAFLIASPGFSAHLDAYHGSFELDGQQEVPPVSSPYLGNCSAILYEVALTISCTTDIPSVTGAHIHAGFPGEAGGVEVPLTAGRVINETVTLTDEQAARAVVGGLYVNLHTEANPGGEIRGQVVLNAVEGAKSLSISGSGASEVTAGDATATIQCRMFFDDDSTPSLRAVCIHDLTDATAAHIHMGAPGVAGGVVFPFADPTNPIVESFDLTADQLAMVESQEMYVNVHNDAFPAGAIRADFTGCIADNDTLCLGDRFAVSVTGTNPNTSATFVGQARALSDTSGTFSFFSADNKEVLIKVLDGCAINSNYWVFFAATTDVKFDLVVTDTRTATSKVYPNPAGMAALPITDTSAFATCP